MSRATNQQIAQGFAQGLQNFTQGYVKRKDREHAQTILDDPKSTPVQKAMAWESIAEGSGHKAYDSILKEQALKKQEETDSAVVNDLFPNRAQQQDVGQRAGVGAVDIPILPQANAKTRSPVELAQQQTGFPGYQQSGQQQEQQMAPEQMQQEQASQDQQNPEQQPQRNITNIPTEELQGMLAAVKGKEVRDVIKSELDKRKADTKANATIEAALINSGQREKEKNRSFALEVNTPYNKRVAGMKASTPVRSRAVQLAKNAVRSGDVGALSLNHLADVLHMPSLKTEEGALLDQAIKTNLIGTLSEVTAKATNIFMEKVALDAFAKTGQSTSANLSKLEALDTELKLNTLETEVYDKILKQDIEQFGSEQPYLELRVAEAVKPLQDDIIKSAAWRMKGYKESDKTYAQLSKNAFKGVVKGTPLSNKMGRVLLDKANGDIDKATAIAERLGYTIYSPEEIKRYEQQ